MCLLRSRLIPGSVSLRRFYSYSYEASRQRYTLAEESSGERPRPLYFKVPSKGKSTQQKQPLASKPNRPPSASFIAASHLEPSRPAARPKAALKNRDGGYAIHAQNMSSHVQIVATPTADTAGAGLLLHFDHRRYHFGTLAQGTQRAISQRGHSLAKLDKIFIAGEVNWETTGGMLGMMLTVADGLAAVAQDVKNSNEARRKEGKREIATPNKTFEIFGGKNTAHTVATARNFIFRTGMPIKAVDLTLDPRAAGGSPTPHDYSKPDWEDDTILVWHVPVARSRPATAAAAAAEAATAATAAGNGTRPVRKRTFDVMHNAEAGAAVTDTRLGSQSPRARSRSASPPRKRQQMAENTVHDIVENMFNSDWSKDGLFETKLADVQMPAKIFIRENGNIKKYDGPTPSTRDVVVPDITVLVRKPWPSAMVTDLPPTTMSDTSLCYVVKNRGRRGKLTPKVAIDLGVAKPDFKRLTAGETVKAMDGKDVTPDMVLEAPMKGQGFAVLAIPSLEHAPGFLERPEWQSDELLDNVQIFYWIFGKGVFDDPSIQEFIKSKPHVRHLVMGPDISPNMITYESYAALFTKLHRLDPARFPVLQFDNTFRDIPKVDGLTVEIGRTGMKAHMLPNFKINDAEIVPFPLLNEAEQIDEQVIALAEEARQRVAEPSFTDLVEQDEKDIPNRDALIVPLGTGSAAPSKYRNVSSTLIRVPGVGSYLLDAGENTIGQLRRAFPAEEYEAIMKELRFIFISHMHADHHLGLADVIAQWRRLTAAEDGQSAQQLVICGPTPMERWLGEYSQVEDLALRRINFIRCDSVSWKTRGGSIPGAPLDSGLASVVAVPVQHCHQAFAGVLTWPSGLKIAYSGDCRPSNDLADAGRGATLLVHESTFDDDKRDDALAKKHSTMGEALGVAKRMGARRVLLTHFSQRYAKIPLVEQKIETAEAGPEAEAKAKDQVVLMAFDQMQVRLGEFRHAAAFLPALRRFFEVEEETKEAEKEKAKEAHEAVEKKRKK
ncbi:hypothetical protein VD0003_g7927 [Verticillium dahliae]|nr:hypothetical protein VD0003_g7927 [Verticillium dahliae]